MKSERGITLVELLVIIAIMGAILAPISMMVIYSLETEKDISAKNDVQREARVIMEYMTEKMRNKNVVWIDEGTRWELKCESSESDIYLIYEPNTNPTQGLGTMKTGSGNVLSTHVKFDPPAIAYDVNDNPIPLTVELTIDKTEETGESLVLNSEIYYDRFNKVISKSGTVTTDESPDDTPGEEVELEDNGSCPPGYYLHKNGKCKKNN